jgi:hypothetical protein
MIMLLGEISSNALVDYQRVVRDTINAIGYDDSSKGCLIDVKANCLIHLHYTCILCIVAAQKLLSGIRDTYHFCCTKLLVIIGTDIYLPVRLLYCVHDNIRTKSVRLS